MSFRWQVLARWGLAGVLLLAAGLKAYELLGARVVSTGFLNSRMVQAGAVAVEAALGAWLISGWAAAWAGRVVAAAFVAFAGVAVWKVAGGEPSCGCFGKMHVRPWQSLVLDLLAIPVGAWIGWGPGSAVRWDGCAKWAVTMVVLGAGGIFVKLAFFAGPPGRPDVKAVVLEPAKWTGKPWLLGQYVDIWPTISQGNWAVLMYSADCEECKPTLKAYAELANAWAARGDSARIAIVSTTEAEPDDGFPDLSRSQAAQGKLETPAGVNWFIPPPTLVILKDGQVLAAVDGEGHCDWEERKFRKW